MPGFYAAGTRRGTSVDPAAGIMIMIINIETAAGLAGRRME
jgi:hypothetical protein